MAIEAPASKYKRNTLIGGIIFLAGFGIYCIYDGYYNEEFIKEHKDAEGNPNSTLVFNQKSPPYLIGAAAFLGVYLFAIKNRKIIADENELIISDKKRISYDSIQRIDKTYFEKKGFFVITYKDKDGKEIRRKLNDRTYDNLAAILEHLVAKIS
jgi:hypothetical protein